ncbi:MAG: DUF2461 domain-containing protein [Actinobacteria bacterium]|nr:DUF2461 domain-containing protein [Actinomycetota bacterium]MBU1493946.1 DUF2461 domain-containing protein [Actinomycetota bacterium]MBU1866265.1 DUF2461 domain-containing protein [Actinomycetota bacterium]
MARYFTPALFAFVKDLKENNDRDWFKAHQDLFESHVREPALRFIEDFSEPLRRVSEHFTADARKVGGSLFRIQRDTRFGTDKTPYKTHVGIHFRHVATRDDVHAPGFYLHLEPGGCFAALGLWQPSTEHAYAIRGKIVEDPAGWKRAAHAKRFTEIYGTLEGDSLKRPPRGIDPDHPLIEDLKRKDFIASTRLRQSDITGDGFMEAYLATVKAGAPFMRYLCEAIGVGF